MRLSEMEGYADLALKLLGGVPPEQRLARLTEADILTRFTQEQLFAGLPKLLSELDRNGQALALPVDIVRLLPEEYLQSLSPEVEGELRRRLQANGH